MPVSTPPLPDSSESTSPFESPLKARHRLNRLGFSDPLDSSKMYSCKYCFNGFEAPVGLTRHMRRNAVCNQAMRRHIDAVITRRSQRGSRQVTTTIGDGRDQVCKVKSCWLIRVCIIEMDIDQPEDTVHVDLTTQRERGKLGFVFFIQVIFTTDWFYIEGFFEGGSRPRGRHSEGERYSPVEGEGGMTVEEGGTPEVTGHSEFSSTSLSSIELFPFTPENIPIKRRKKPSPLSSSTHQHQQGTKPRNPWSPFSSGATWKLAEWLMTSGLSNNDQDRFFKLEEVIEFSEVNKLSVNSRTSLLDRCWCKLAQ